MRMLLMLVAVSLISSAATAETINFKDGRSLKGKIVQQDDSQVKVDLKGVTMTYYKDEIKDIDGVAVEQPAAVTKAPAKQEAVEPMPALEPAVAEPAPQPAAAAVSEDPAQKRELVLKFIDVFGTRKAMTDNFNAILNELGRQKPEEAQKIRDKFNIDEVIERLIPSYEKQFSSEDLQAYIDFYSSPRGKKLTTSIGLVMRDSIEIGSNYIKEKFPELGQ